MIDFFLKKTSNIDEKKKKKKEKKKEKIYKGEDDRSKCET